MPDQNLKIYIGSKIVDSKEVGVSTSCEMQNIRLVQKEAFNFQIRKRKYHSFESKFSILYHEVWGGGADWSSTSQKCEMPENGHPIWEVKRA